MEENKNLNELQIELPEEVAEGTYSNLAVVAHSMSEFIIDFIRMVPGVPKAKVKSRVILTPDNARRLMLVLQDNLRQYEDQQKRGMTANFEDFVPSTGGMKGDA